MPVPDNCFSCRARYDEAMETNITWLCEIHGIVGVSQEDIKARYRAMEHVVEAARWVAEEAYGDPDDFKALIHVLERLDMLEEGKE